MRRSRIGRRSVSTSSPPRNAGAGARKAPPATMGMTFVGMGVYPEDNKAAPPGAETVFRSVSRSVSRLGFPLLSRPRRGIGTLRSCSVFLLLEVAMLRRALRVDLALLRIGAFLLFVLRRALACARGRRGRIDLRRRRCIGLRSRLRRRFLRTGGGVHAVGALVASGGQCKRGGQNADLQTHTFSP